MSYWGYVLLIISLVFRRSSLTGKYCQENFTSIERTFPHELENNCCFFQFGTEPRKMLLKQTNSTSSSTEASFLIRSISLADNVPQRETSWRSSYNVRLCFYSQFTKVKELNFLGQVTPIRKTKHTNYRGLFTIKYYGEVHP